MKKLTPEFVAALLKVQRDEKLTHAEKLLINQFLQKSEEGKLTHEDIVKFAKTFFEIGLLIKKLIEQLE